MPTKEQEEMREPIIKPQLKFDQLSPGNRKAMLSLIRELLGVLSRQAAFPSLALYIGRQGVEANEEAVVTLFDEGVLRVALREGRLKLKIYDQHYKCYRTL